MALDAGEITQIRAAVQAELEEYGGRLWGETGTAGRFMARTDTRTADIQNTVHRIEDDTDSLSSTLGKANQ